MLDNYGQEKYDMIRQKIDSPEYLIQHMTLQKVLQIDNVTLPSYMGATQAPNGPFSLIHAINWDSFLFVDHLISKIKFKESHIQKPEFIKLRGWERSILETQIV